MSRKFRQMSPVFLKFYIIFLISAFLAFNRGYKQDDFCVLQIIFRYNIRTKVSVVRLETAEIIFQVLFDMIQPRVISFDAARPNSAACALSVYTR